jgi:hypothetical protein
LTGVGAFSNTASIPKAACSLSESASDSNSD